MLSWWCDLELTWCWTNLRLPVATATIRYLSYFGLGLMVFSPICTCYYKTNCDIIYVSEKICWDQFYQHFWKCAFWGISLHCILKRCVKFLSNICCYGLSTGFYVNKMSIILQLRRPHGIFSNLVPIVTNLFVT